MEKWLSYLRKFAKEVNSNSSSNIPIRIHEKRKIERRNKFFEEKRKARSLKIAVEAIQNLIPMNH